jgi:hypothetical protein
MATDQEKIALATERLIAMGVDPAEAQAITQTAMIQEELDWAKEMRNRERSYGITTPGRYGVFVAEPGAAVLGGLQQGIGDLYTKRKMEEGQEAATAQANALARALGLEREREIEDMYGGVDDNLGLDVGDIPAEAIVAALEADQGTPAITYPAPEGAGPTVVPMGTPANLAGGTADEPDPVVQALMGAIEPGSQGEDAWGMPPRGAADAFRQLPSQPFDFAPAPRGTINPPGGRGNRVQGADWGVLGGFGPSRLPADSPLRAENRRDSTASGYGAPSEGGGFWSDIWEKYGPKRLY